MSDNGTAERLKTFLEQYKGSSVVLVTVFFNST